MPSTNKTEHALNQWLPTDKPMLDDFNADNAAIDLGVMWKSDIDPNNEVETIPGYVSEQIAANAISTSKRQSLINTGFDHWQRGVSLTGTSTYSYGPDRWQIYGDGVTFERVANTSPSKGKYAIRITQNSSASVFYLRQLLEDAIANDKGFSSSLYVRASTSMTLNYRIADSSGSTSSATRNVTTTWSKFTHTNLTLSDIAKLELFVSSLPANTWIEISPIMPSEGVIAIEYQSPDPSLELLRCQRYCQPLHSQIVLYGYVKSTTVVQLYIPYATPMRTVPTLINAEELRASLLYRMGGSTIATGGATDIVTTSWTTDNGMRIELTIASGALPVNHAVFAALNSSFASGWPYLDAEIY